MPVPASFETAGDDQCQTRLNYGIEEAPDATRFLVMELLEGGTLAGRLRGGALPIGEALAIARDIADGLHSAHERGIIHRDVKPANVAFAASGHAKVLDFGLAKTHTPPSDATVTAAQATAQGIVLGTAAYMSPEQARGQALDKRTDIWSFGCVLYEMLTGRHLFAAATPSDVVARVLGDAVDWTVLPPRTPPRVAWLLRRCLEKDVRRRLQDIGDARVELEETLAPGADSGASAAQPVEPGAADTAAVGVRLDSDWCLSRV